MCKNYVKQRRFCSILDAAWLNEGRVGAVALLSGKTKKKVANSLKTFQKMFRESNKLENNEETNTDHIAISQRVQSRCSLFLGRSDQGLVGNVESMHVNRPRGRAMVVSKHNHDRKSNDLRQAVTSCLKGRSPAVPLITTKSHETMQRRVKQRPEEG